MKTKARGKSALLTGLAGLFFAVVALPALTAFGQTSPAEADPASGARRSYHKGTGRVSFIGAEPARPISVRGARGAKVGPEQRAAAVAEAYGREFGLKEPSRELRRDRVKPARDGRSVVRYQQVHEGIPVLGGELNVNLDADGGLLSMNGEISPEPLVSTQPQVEPARALEIAKKIVARTYGVPFEGMTVTEPALWIFDERLLRSSTRPVALVWRIEVSVPNRPVRELVLIDAHRGSVNLHFNQIDTFWSRRKLQERAAAGATATDPVGGTAFATAVPDAAADAPLASTPLPLMETYDAKNEYVLPGDLVCNQDDLSCLAGDLHARKAHENAYGTFDLYYQQHGREYLLDAPNPKIVSTVHAEEQLDNAYWDPDLKQVVYGDKGYDYPYTPLNFTNADDVVAHELTHGVTQFESNLFYAYQSGAISESLSDIWGEAYDQLHTSSTGTDIDTAAVKWLIGEDITGLGAVRSMKNPPSFRDPDAITSAYYVKDLVFDDSGGVHANSGVNNKAAYLMVDGGSFNGKTVAPIGWTKVLAIYYEAQTNLLTSGSDYLDLYNALSQACVTLVDGAEGITDGDCLQVRAAADAVRMNAELPGAFNPSVAYCPAGSAPYELFGDDFEGGLGNWAIDSAGSDAWSLVDGSTALSNATSGTNSLWGDDLVTENDSRIAMSVAEAVAVPPGAYLHFKHYYDLDSGYLEADPTLRYFDGGVLEYSANGGLWTDAEQLFSAGRNYNGTLLAGYGNILGGRKAFSGLSHGFVDSRYSLATLAGRTVRFRWRLATDSDVYFYGWFVDDVRIYRCVALPAAPILKSPINGSLQTNPRPSLAWGPVSAPAGTTFHHYQLQVSDGAGFSRPLIDADVTSPGGTIGLDLAPNTRWYWRVRAFNSYGGSLQAGNWSAVFSFRTALLPPAVVSAPSGTVYNKRPTFVWEGVAGATGYTVQVSKNSTFTLLAGTYNPVAPPYTPTVDLPASTPLWWRVQSKGANGPSLWSTAVSFTTRNPPAIPVLSAPALNALTTDPTPLLDWGNVTVPVGTTFAHYQVQVDDSADFSSPVTDAATTADDVTDSDYTPGSDLAANTKWYWRVRSFNAGATVSPGDDEHSAWSAVRNFRTALLAPESLIAPVGPEPNKRPTFEWLAVAGATGYTVQVSRNVGFTLLAGTYSPSASTYTPTVDLPAGTELWWRVQSKGANGPSLWSAPTAFHTANPPAIPVLAAPALNALTTDYTPLLDWGNVMVPVGTTFAYYQVQVDNNADFSNPVIDATTTPSSDFTPGFELAANTKWYWRVRAFNTGATVSPSDDEYSAWSAVRYFRTALAVPSLQAPYNGEEVSDPYFQWSGVDGAINYTLEVSRTMNFATLVYRGTFPVPYTPSLTLPASLDPDPPLPLYWRVRANSATGGNGPSAWSVVWSFGSVSYF